MTMVDWLAQWREPSNRPHTLDPVQPQQIFHARHIGTNDFFVTNHDRLVVVADVVRTARPLRGSAWRDDEHRLFEFGYDDNHARLFDDQAIARSQHAAALKRGAELQAAVRCAPRPCLQAFFPSKRDAIALAGPRVLRKGVFSINRSANR